MKFNKYVELPSAVLDWTSSNEGAKFIKILFWMSETSLDIFYEMDDVDKNEMNWYVLGVNHQKMNDSR